MCVCFFIMTWIFLRFHIAGNDPKSIFFGVESLCLKKKGSGCNDAQCKVVVHWLKLGGWTSLQHV